MYVGHRKYSTELNILDLGKSSETLPNNDCVCVYPYLTAVDLRKYCRKIVITKYTMTLHYITLIQNLLILVWEF